MPLFKSQKCFQKVINSKHFFELDLVGYIFLLIIQPTDKLFFGLLKTFWKMISYVDRSSIFGFGLDLQVTANKILLFNTPQCDRCHRVTNAPGPCQHLVGLSRTIIRSLKEFTLHKLSFRKMLPNVLFSLFWCDARASFSILVINCDYSVTRKKIAKCL